MTNRIRKGAHDMISFEKFTTCAITSRLSLSMITVSKSLE